jgi:hypothetical protein
MSTKSLSTVSSWLGKNELDGTSWQSINCQTINADTKIFIFKTDVLLLASVKT